MLAFLTCAHQIASTYFFTLVQKVTFNGQIMGFTTVYHSSTL